MIEIKEIDIFNNITSQTKDDNQSDTVKSKKIFPKIDINTGLYNSQLQSDYVLIHRILQKKLTSNLDKDIRKFITILINEMYSKKNKYDINLITRDTLLEYYLK